jgi:tetratricopeptide (TPR) repeat protein
MPGEGSVSLKKHRALSAFERGDNQASALIEDALTDLPMDGELLIAQAATLLRAGISDPFARLERILSQAPDWIDGHKALGRLKVEALHPKPFGSIEAALETLPRAPRLWMAYLTLLGSAGRHREAAQHTARLRKQIADLPELTLVEARHRGLAGDIETAHTLLSDLPANLPELDFERARNAMRMGELALASEALERVLAQDPSDIGAWALAELCWRALGHPRQQWLCPDDALFVQSDLGLSPGQLTDLANTLRALHVSRAAPLGQSVKGGTQTHGNLRLRDDPEIASLFASIDAVLKQYTAALPALLTNHPMHSLGSRSPKITASWSILLSNGGRHVPHLHNSGLISSAVHIAVPDELARGEGNLELGRPPEDIPLELAPLVRFEPKPGHLVLFPSFIYHSTSPFAEGERLTVAFDAS